MTALLSAAVVALYLLGAASHAALDAGESGMRRALRAAAWPAITAFLLCALGFVIVVGLALRDEDGES